MSESSKAKPDANGWYLVSEVQPPEATRVMYFFPALSKQKHEEAHVGIQQSFISDYQRWKPTHWQPEPLGPAENDLFGSAA